MTDSSKTRRPRSEAQANEDPAPVDPDEDVIDEASEESFPASDSPSSWAGPPSDSR